MQVKTDFKGKPPKLTFGYSAIPALVGCALAVALGIEWACRVKLGVILATAAGGAFLLWRALYTCDGYWMDHTGLYYSPLVSKKKTCIFSWTDVEDVYLTMHWAYQGLSCGYSFAECIIITTKKWDCLLTYEQANNAAFQGWCRAFSLNSDMLHSHEKYAIDKHSLMAFAKQIGLEIADHTHEHPCYHDPKLKKYLYIHEKTSYPR